ncbi:ABC transporter permease [Lachnospiraceae bacterium 62-35]
MAVLLCFVSIAVFVLLSISPIDPLKTNVGQAALGSMSQEQIEKLKAYWGAGIPMGKRFLFWAGDFLKGDMGMSLLYRRPVLEVIGEKFSNSICLMAAAWMISGCMGFLLGILAGKKRGSAADRLVTGYALTVASTPAFWLSMVLLMVFAVWLKILPTGFSVPVGTAAGEAGFRERILHAILPASALSLTGISHIALQTREKMIEVMESDYVLFARARGDSEASIIWRHGIRNVMLPAVTLQLASISEIFGGSVLVEQVFSYPGLGQAAIAAGLGSDVPLLLGITIISAGIVFVGNTAANLLYGIVDPRMRRGGKRL